MATDDLRAFIEARLADDDQEATRKPEPDAFDDRYIADCPPWLAEQIARGSLARNRKRAIREIAAKRAILAAVDKYLDPHPGQPCTNEDEPWFSECELHVAAAGRVSDNALPLLASVWSDHADYRSEWGTA